MIKTKGRGIQLPCTFHMPLAQLIDTQRGTKRRMNQSYDASKYTLIKLK